VESPQAGRSNHVAEAAVVAADMDQADVVLHDFAALGHEVLATHAQQPSDDRGIRKCDGRCGCDGAGPW